jgi:hypothetical protein
MHRSFEPPNLPLSIFSYILLGRIRPFWRKEQPSARPAHVAHWRLLLSRNGQCNSVDSRRDPRLQAAFEYLGSDLH